MLFDTWQEASDFIAENRPKLDQGTVTARHESGPIAWNAHGTAPVDGAWDRLFIAEEGERFRVNVERWQEGSLSQNLDPLVVELDSVA